MTGFARNSYDLVVVGAGIVGLAAAWAGVQRGMKVAVLERNAAAIGASIRNFGFVTVTGQRAGAHWRRAMRSRDVWRSVAPKAGIDIVHDGLHLLARRPEAVAVLEAFMATDMADGCRLLTSGEAAPEAPLLQPGLAVLHSPHECRVESRDAIPRLAAWLASAHGVDFHWDTAVHDVTLPHVVTSRGTLRSAHAIVCPGNDLTTLFPDVIAPAGLVQCTLQMLRVEPAQPVRLPAAVMSDLSLVRYEGYSALPEAAALRTRLIDEQREYLDAGIHLIVVQSADGSLVVGDTHVYGPTEAPFAREQWNQWMLAEMERTLRLPGARVSGRWTGSYASGNDVVLAAAPSPGVSIGIVTGGTGASTGFAFAEELLAMALDEAAPIHQLHPTGSGVPDGEGSEHDMMSRPPPTKSIRLERT